MREEDLPPEVASDAPLAGKTVVITGTISDPRAARRSRGPTFQRLCEKAGATTASSVSANTDMLICGADVGASKTAKAEKLEVEVVDQAEIWEHADRRRDRLDQRVGVPGRARVGRAVAHDGGLDQPVRPVVGVEDLVRVLEPERRQVDDEVVLVGHRQPHLCTLGQASSRASPIAYSVCCSDRLWWPANASSSAARAASQSASPGMAPARGDLGREHAVGRLCQRRVAVAREAVELGVGRLEHHEAGDPGRDQVASRLAIDDGDPLLARGLREGVVVSRVHGASLISTRARVIAPPRKCRASRAANSSGVADRASFANA